MRNGKYMKNTHQKPLSLSKMVEQTWRCRGENLGQLNGPVDLFGNHGQSEIRKQ